MNTLIQHIEYLTGRHDCVVVPGLGAFIAQYESARISEDGMTIVPPSRMIVFNGAIMHNDALLATSVARKEKMHYDDALSLVKQGVTGLKRQLEIDGEITIGSLGRLVAVENGSSVVFESSASAADCTEFALLKPLALDALHVSVNGSDEIEHALNIEIVPSVYSPLRNILRIAASFALIIALSLCLTTPISVNEVNLASMGVSDTAVTTHKNVSGTSRASVSLARLNHGVGIEVIDTASHNAYRREMLANALSGKYFLIVASLPNEVKAQEYMAYNPDSRLKLLKTDSRCRVYIASASTQAEALKMASDSDIVSEYPDVWVYRAR